MSNHKFIEEFYKLKYCSTVVYMVQEDKLN